MAKKNEPEINVRLLIKRNLLDVVEIEKASCYTNDPDFGKIQNDSAWSSSSFTSFVRKKNTFSYVIYENSKIVGFILIENVANETIIEKLVVLPMKRRYGYGTAMIDFLIQKKFKPIISAYCREDDNESIKFYSNKKFKSKLEKKYFPNDIDAVKFTVEIDHEK